MTFFLRKYQLLQPLQGWPVSYPMYTSVSSNTITDEALVKAVLQKDKDAFRVLIRRYEKLVIQIVFRMIKRPEDQQDICQEVFLKVYDKIGTFRFGSKLSTWIGTITFNTCINFLRTNRMVLLNERDDEEELNDRQPFNTAEDPRQHPDELLLRKEQKQLLWQYVEELPAIQKTIISLFHQQEHTIEEIAAMLTMPAGTIKSYLHRARQTLKNKLHNS